MLCASAGGSDGKGSIPQETPRGDSLLTEKQTFFLPPGRGRTEMWEDKMQDKIFQDKPRDMEMKELKEAANLNLLF